MGTTDNPIEHKYHLKNTLEDTVISEVSAKMKNIPDVCKCEKCFYDICAIALNALPPHYTTTEQGHLMQKTNTTLNLELHGRMLIEIIKAIELVTKSPKHG